MHCKNYNFWCYCPRRANSGTTFLLPVPEEDERVSVKLNKRTVMIIDSVWGCSPFSTLLNHLPPPRPQKSVLGSIWGWGGGGEGAFLTMSVDFFYYFTKYTHFVQMKLNGINLQVKKFYFQKFNPYFYIKPKYIKTNIFFAEKCNFTK